GLSFSLACFASCFFALAAAMRIGGFRWPAFASLTDNAYGIYLVHYGFVGWVQYALLSPKLPAITKGGILVAGTLAISVRRSAGWGRVRVRAQFSGQHGRGAVWPLRGEPKAAVPASRRRPRSSPIAARHAGVQRLSPAGAGGNQLAAGPGFPLPRD